jgi:hypothetical protein
MQMEATCERASQKAYFNKESFMLECHYQHPRNAPVDGCIPGSRLTIPKEPISCTVYGCKVYGRNRIQYGGQPYRLGVLSASFCDVGHR